MWMSVDPVEDDKSLYANFIWVAKLESTAIKDKIVSKSISTGQKRMFSLNENIDQKIKEVFRFGSSR